MGYPCPIKSLYYFSALIGFYLCEGVRVECWIFSVGDEGRHAPDGQDTPTVGYSDYFFCVGAQEGHFHSKGFPLRQDKASVPLVGLDYAKKIVPSARIEAGDVFSQLIDDFFYLKCSREGLNEYRNPNCTQGQA